MRTFIDSLVILSILSLTLRLATSGYLTVEQAGVAMMLLTAAAAVAHSMGMSLAGLLLRVGMPLAGLVIFLWMQTGGNSQAMAAASVPLLALAIALGGLYLMVRGVVGGSRKR